MFTIFTEEKKWMNSGILLCAIFSQDCEYGKALSIIKQRMINKYLKWGSSLDTHWVYVKGSPPHQIDSLWFLVVR